MKLTCAKHTVAAVLVLGLLATGIHAQQRGEMGGKLPAKPAAAESSPAGARAPDTMPELTESERLLLERIDRLERRLAELESRTAAGPPALSGSPQPASAGTALNAANLKKGESEPPAAD